MDLTVQLVGANGDTIVFDNQTYALTKGVKGFGVPTTTLRIQEGASNGGFFRNSKRGIREMDLPVTVFGADRATTEAALRRLSKVMDNTNGATVLQVINPDDGSTYSMNIYYAGGAETVFGDSATSNFCNWLLTVQAPDPFWYSSAAQSFTVTSGQTGRGLLPRLSNLRVTNSQAIGSITVNNLLGDVASYPVWQLTGPMDSCTVTQKGVGFTYNAPVAAGQTVIIDTFASTVTDAATGANLYANLSAAPKFFTIPSGTSTMYVYGANATTATAITCTYKPRREVIH
jgi:phage-related protein